MSERGSFVTEYIHCPRCFEIVKEVLAGNSKYLDSHPMENYPIMVGKIGGLYEGEELDTFRFEFNRTLAEKICHPVRIAVLAEVGSEIFEILPKDLSADRKA